MNKTREWRKLLCIRDSGFTANFVSIITVVMLLFSGANSVNAQNRANSKAVSEEDYYYSDAADVTFQKAHLSDVSEYLKRNKLVNYEVVSTPSRSFKVLLEGRSESKRDHQQVFEKLQNLGTSDRSEYKIAIRMPEELWKKKRTSLKEWPSKTFRDDLVNSNLFSAVRTCNTGWGGPMAAREFNNPSLLGMTAEALRPKIDGYLVGFFTKFYPQSRVSLKSSNSYLFTFQIITRDFLTPGAKNWEKLDIDMSLSPSNQEKHWLLVTFVEAEYYAPSAKIPPLSKFVPSGSDAEMNASQNLVTNLSDFLKAVR